MRCGSYFSILLFFCVMKISSAVDDWRWYHCKNVSTYADGSTYSANLNQVMTDLLKNTPQSSGFNTSSFGQTSDKVYGLLQCIGNVSANKCSDCAQKSNSYLRELCPNYIGGHILRDDCFLRYDNYSFFSQLDSNPYFSFNSTNVAANIDNFKANTSSLLSYLSNLAYEPANKGLAIGSANYSTSHSVYGLVQCWRDLSINDCRVCLLKARNKLEECCSVKQGGLAMSKSCMARFEIYKFFDTAQSSSSEAPPLTPTNSTPPFPEAPPPTPTKGQIQSKNKSKTLAIIGGVVGCLILALLLFLFVMRKRLRFAIFTHNKESRADFPFSELSIHDQQHFIFTLKDLVEATKNFHEDNKLGEGGFGAVYKGIARDGKEIAIKKLSKRSSQGDTEFMNEVRLMANLDNRNLVKLFGCCVEGDEKLLVYEYFPNKSLDTFIFDPEKRKQLDWEKRYKIIVGIARGLLYLHEDSQQKIIHRDIKAANIMLDEKLKPKIADFGLARLFPEDKTRVQTKIVAGTHGYMAPEYAIGGQLSVKGDVYSFGVLLLEIVSGRKIVDNDFPEEMENLLEWAWRLYRGGDVLPMVESTVVETCQHEQVIRCIQVGLLCVQEKAIARPDMWKVNMMISSSSETLPSPTRPWSVNFPDSQQHIHTVHL